MEDSEQRMAAFMQLLFMVADETGINFYTTKSGNIVLEDEHTKKTRMLTPEGINALHEDYEKHRDNK